VQLAHFEILGSLGRWGMGAVYRARDSRLRREVAIKVLPVSFARDPDRIARFEREAHVAGALNHPNTVSVYDIGRDNSTYWIVPSWSTARRCAASFSRSLARSR
jgi:serine/threonine protein kinase